MRVIRETFEVGNNLRVSREACEIGVNKISEMAEAQGSRYLKYYSLRPEI